MPDERYPLPNKSGQTGNAWPTSVEAGLRTVETHYSGTVDPSTGHGWDADDTHSGIVWKDLTDPYNPRWREWTKLDTGGTDYGWRDLGLRKERRCAPTAITFAPAPTRAADQGWTALDLSALLDTVQDAGQVKATVCEVLLHVRAKADAAETLGDDDGYIAFRATGDTSDGERVMVPRDGGVGGRWADVFIWVPLDAAESMDWMADVGGGVPAFDYEAEICGFKEALA